MQKKKKSKKSKFVPLCYDPVQYFALDSPYQLIECLDHDRKRHGSQWIVKWFLQNFEYWAQDFLKKMFAKYDYLPLKYFSTDPSDLWWLKEDLNKRILDDNLEIPIKDLLLISHAIEVIYAADRLKEHIDKKDPEEAAIEMMRLVFSALSVSLRDQVLDGWKLQGNRRRGGRKTKKRFGILGAIEKVLKEKNMSATELWHYFKRNYCGEDNQYVVENPVYYEVWFYPNPTGHDRLVQKDEQENEKTITKHTFRKYVSEVKRHLQQQTLKRAGLDHSPA